MTGLSETPRLDGKGFVLIEVLVVAVIMAALAAVAIPVYTGYMQTQRMEMAKNLAQSTAAAANIYTRRTGAPPACTHATVPSCVTLLNVFLSDPARYQIDIAGRTVTVTDQAYAGVAGSSTF